MKRLTVTIFLSILFGQLVNAQQYYLNGDSVIFEFRLPGTNPTLGTIYFNEQPCEGELTKKDSIGNTVLVKQVKNGKGNGFYKIFYPNGSIREVGRQKDNFSIGIRMRYFESGELASIEHFPEEALGNIDGTEKISFYENGDVEINYAYNPDWIPKFHYEFSETGDTLMKIEPLLKDSTVIEITEFREDGPTLIRSFRLNDEGQREYIIQEK